MLSLWTRATPDDAWTIAPARLEDGVLSAELLHFSEYGLGSGSQNDLVQEAGDWQIVTQASAVGVGWRLDGVNYIARQGRENKFSLVLNGQSATLLKQDGVWRTSPALFAGVQWAGDGTSTGYGQWTVTTTDGVRYEFGDAGAMADSFVVTSTTALALEQTPS